MEELFTYLLKSSGLIAAFFLSYHFLLRKETFFTSNRWFLIAGLITSALLPLFFIKKVVFVESPQLTANDLLLLSNQSTTSTIIHQQVETINWTQLVLFTYSLVVLFLIIKIAVNIISLFRLLQNKEILKYDNFSFVDLQEDIAPFSFFNFIVFNSSLYSQNELESILLHEKVHSQQKHSIDVLITTIFSVLFWFNPFIWLYKKAIIQNLEYIADNKAMQQIDDKKVYQKALLKVVLLQNYLPITNHFYQSLIKKRIVMLNKNQSHKRNLWKYAVVIPALIAFVFLFQVKIIAQEKETNKNVKTIQTHEGVEITFDSKETDKSLKTLKNVFKEEKIVTEVSKIKRNSAGEIIGLQIKMKSEDGRKKELKINQSNPIDNIFIYTNRIGNGIYDFDVKHFNDNEIRAIKSKIDKKRKVSYLSKNEEDSFSFYFNDSIPEIKNFDFDIEIPELAELPEAPESPEQLELLNELGALNSNSRVVIQNDNEKPIVIVNGEVVEGADQLSEQDLKRYSYNYSFNNKNKLKTQISKIRTKALNDSRTQLKKMRPQLMAQVKREMERSREDIERARDDMERARPEMERAREEMERSRPDMEKAKAEMLQARVEMLQAKAEMEQAKAELEKAKAELKK